MSEAGETSGPDDGSRLHVVLVVGSDDEAEAVARLLAAGRMEVDVTTDPSTALDHLRTVAPDAVVVGTDVPDGVAPLLAALRALDGPSAKLPVVVTGGRTPAPERFRTWEAGADAILTKPFHIDELRSTIRSLASSTPADRERDRSRALQDERKATSEATGGAGRPPVTPDRSGQGERKFSQ